MTLVDFYGFGKTPHPDRPIFLDDYAESIVELIDHYQMSDVVLVGHSFGGRVAIRIAARRGYLLNKIVLIDSAGIRPHRGLKYYYRVYRHKILTKLNVPHLSGSEDYRRLSNVMKQTFKNVVNEDQTPELHKVTLPVLLLWGSKDKDTPIYMARRMKREMSGSALITFEGAGHYSYIEKYGLFLNILQIFLAGGDDELDNSLIADNSRRSRVVKIPVRQPE